MLDKILKDFQDNEELIRKLEEAGGKIAETEPTLTQDEIRMQALKELGYELSAEEAHALFTAPSAEMTLEDMAQVAGGRGMKRRRGPKPGEVEGCPVHGEAGHQYHADGQMRGTTNIFYHTEEHYVCDCGKGYWDAGFFAIRHWD